MKTLDKNIVDCKIKSFDKNIKPLKLVWYENAREFVGQNGGFYATT
jgi:hypothetical protein